MERRRTESMPYLLRHGNTGEEEMVTVIKERMAE